MKPSASSLSRREGRSRNFGPFCASLFRCVIRQSCPGKCYVDVNNNERLDEDEIKLLALVSKQEKQVNVDSPLEGGWGTSV